MRPVHLIGLGLIAGMTALGAMLATAAYQWQVEAYPQQGGVAAAAAHQAGQGAGSAASQEVSQGKALFTQKCASCHSVGGGKRLGPDLKGVTTQREHDWLVEFIVAPDQVIARGDPIAAQLVKEYGTPMPNLGVSTAEAEQILAYLGAESGGSVPAAAPAPASKAAPPAPAPAAKPVAAAPATQAGSRGKTLFDQKCASCHSIGGGKLAGPDLKGITSQRERDWLIEFTVAPDRVIASGDPIAAQLVKEYGMPMPNVGVSKAEAEEILAYVESQSGGGATPPGAAVAPADAAPGIVKPGDSAAGRALFTGERAMANGGPACMSCHNVAGTGPLAGGSWGFDLTNSHSRTGAAGLAAIMKSPPFPGMKEAYATHSVSDAEVADLVAFFAEMDGQRPGASQAGPAIDFTFPLIGLVAFAAMAGLAHLAWRRRTVSVRKPLVGGTDR